MSDRELLELAAKAVGFGQETKYGPCWTESEYPRGSGLQGALWNHKGWGETAELWNPLTDDGDALRLAVKLNMICTFESQCVIVEAQDGPGPVSEKSNYRRAIVRAAASLAQQPE